ncbi:hypothetical protein [uncultured Winogradskyella sp.]|uniref:hypothetical protein n=1 Tax=uncultured Winogradskyella sp. TaxID=395353 RepID=UPI002610FC76|nr:hypothetical protein [uncultured Winogradskyella sp.]
MKSTKFISTLLFVLLIILNGCQLDDGPYDYNNQQENIPDTFSDYFGNEINRDFIGNVVDKYNQPLSGVAITIGGETVQTDINGIFILEDAIVNERFGYVKATKAGYLDGSRSIVPAEGTNKVEIMLLEANPIATINSGSAETVSLTNGSSVSFDGNFVKEDGSLYDGSVDVIMHHLDPTDDDMEMQMPGMLYAQNEDGAERMLQTLGMLAVELRGSGGEDLNLAEGSTSEIKIPVDASLMSMAPATIPLWYFDEINGFWKEEGQAILQGNFYVGIVSHFSFWNCDIPAEAITLCVIVTDAENNPINYLTINITSSVFGTRNGFTNERGVVCGLVPSNETLILEIYQTEVCGDLSLISENIGPFSSDDTISIVIPDNGNISTETIVGTINNCENESIENGYVIYTHNDNSTYQLVSDGNFEFNVSRCTTVDTFSLRAINLDASETTNTTEYEFDTPITNVGALNTCISQEEYIIYSIDSTTEVFFEDNIDVDLNENNFTIIRLFDNSTTSKFLADLPSQTGNYVTSSTNTMIFNFAYLQDGYLQYITASTYGISIDVTYIGSGIGDFIDIGFNGTFLDPQGLSHTIQGNAHVRIDE